MKQYVNRLPAIMLMAVLLSVFLSGCVEHRYYRRNNHHTRRYYERRHTPPPAGVDIEIHH
ncbi:MAG: hypothetical protein ABIR15_18595 [Chitinophagaceae bacterium]